MSRTLVSFDWALKRLLRSKANFGILEGFLTELLGSAIRIDELLESESNRDFDVQKSNRLDLNAATRTAASCSSSCSTSGKMIFSTGRCFGVSRALTEHLHAGQTYGELPKVISLTWCISIWGQGDDYIYHGRTHLLGIHTHDEGCS